MAASRDPRRKILEANTRGAMVNAKHGKGALSVQARRPSARQISDRLAPPSIGVLFRGVVHAFVASGYRVATQVNIQCLPCLAALAHLLLLFLSASRAFPACQFVLLHACPLPSPFSSVLRVDSFNLASPASGAACGRCESLLTCVPVRAARGLTLHAIVSPCAAEPRPVRAAPCAVHHLKDPHEPGAPPPPPPPWPRYASPRVASLLLPTRPTLALRGRGGASLTKRSCSPCTRQMPRSTASRSSRPRRLRARAGCGLRNSLTIRTF